MPTASFPRGGSSERPTGTSGCASSPPTRIPTTIRSPPSAGPIRRHSKQRFCRCCSWRAGAACCGWARCRSTAPRSTPTPRRSARCAMTGRRCCARSWPPTIAALTAQAEAADAEDEDPQALPAEIARRAVLKAKLDAACARLEAEAKAQADAERPHYEAKKAAYDAKKGRRGRPPKPPDETPPPTRQSNLTDPDSALMRRSDAHEYRQAYNAQAVVCAEGSQLILATNLVATSADAPSFAATILAMEKTVGLPGMVLADAGFAGGEAVAELEARNIQPLVAIT